MNRIAAMSMILAAMSTSALANPVLTIKSVPEKGRTEFGYRVIQISSKSRVRITLTRPDEKRDMHIVLAVAGTYTNPFGRPDGLVIDAGKVTGTQRKVWDGALVTVQGHADILDTRGATRITRRTFDVFERRQGSLVQGHLLVAAGDPDTTLDPKTIARRRAFVRFFWTSDGAIVESDGAISLRAFARDLAELGATMAINLDMGEWSYGWFRDPTNGTVRMLGCCKDKASRQTNWLVVELPE